MDLFQKDRAIYDVKPDAGIAPKRRLVLPPLMGGPVAPNESQFTT